MMDQLTRPQSERDPAESMSLFTHKIAAKVNRSRPGCIIGSNAAVNTSCCVRPDYHGLFRRSQQHQSRAGYPAFLQVDAAISEAVVAAVSVAGIPAKTAEIVSAKRRNQHATACATQTKSDRAV